VNEDKNQQLQQAKWKRAQDVFNESCDMDPGDAAIMFVIAAVKAQTAYYDGIVRRTMNGEEIPELAPVQDVEFFRAMREILKPGRYKEQVEGFLASSMYRTYLSKAVQTSLLDAVERLVLANSMNEILRKHGKGY
jgi:hypothetical protein